MKYIKSILILLAPLAALHAAEQSLTELSCTDFRPTQEAVERYRDLRGACEGIVERDGELYAKFAATVQRVSRGGGSIEFYLPATDHTFTVEPDANVRVWIGEKKVRARELAPGQEIRVYLAVNAIARPDIDEVAFVTEDDLIVELPAERGETVQKPARVTTTLIRTEVIVESFDPDTRELMVIDADGNRVTIVADERVGSLANLEASDRIAVEYLESIAIVVAPGGFETAASGNAGILAVSADEERPALVGADTTVIVATVEALSVEERWATLRLQDGSAQTIQVSEDARLDLVNVGDEVRFQITRAMAISIEEPR